MSSPLLIGLEIGGTKLQASVGLGDGVIRETLRTSIDAQAGSEGIKPRIIELVDELRRRHSPAGFPVMGVGFGGPVDASKGRILRSHQIQGWNGFPLAEWLRASCRVPLVVVENDSDVAALAEARFGAGKDASPLLYVNSGSGIGGGLVIDGEIYRGSGLGALEIGHVQIELDGQPASSLESLASGWAIALAGRHAVAREPLRTRILARLREARPGPVTGQLVGEAALAGDPAAHEILDRATRAMAWALANAVTLLAPRRVVLGGGVSLLDESLWLEPIRRRVEALVYPGFRGSFDIVCAALGEEVVVHGALAAARAAWSVLACG
jgi:glucokinase